MTRRQDSQQHKMNKLQSSSGLVSSLMQRLFIRNLLERKVTAPSCALGVLRQQGWR